MHKMGDFDRVMEWVHNAPSVCIVKLGDAPIHAHVTFLFLSALILGFGITHSETFWYTVITLSIGWLTSLLTSLSHFHVTRAIGGKIEKDVLWPLGGISPASYEGVPNALKLMAAIAGPMLLFPFFVLYFIAGGAHLDLIIGRIAPGGEYGNVQTVMVWASSLMIWLMILNFAIPLHPLTGFELLRHTVGRFTSRTGLVATAFVLTVPWTYILISHGAFYGNLLQLWFGIWMMPQQIQMAMALTKSDVDHLAFFAGEGEADGAALSPVQATSVPKAVTHTYGKMEEKPWTPAETQPAPPAPLSQKVTMKVTSGMKLPPGTYTIEDSLA
jgi:hypothetical protein